MKDDNFDRTHGIDHKTAVGVKAHLSFIIMGHWTQFPWYRCVLHVAVEEMLPKSKNTRQLRRQQWGVYSPCLHAHSTKTINAQALK